MAMLREVIALQRRDLFCCNLPPHDPDKNRMFCLVISLFEAQLIDLKFVCLFVCSKLGSVSCCMDTVLGTLEPCR